VEVRVNWKRFNMRKPLVLILLVMLAGTIGYSLLEGYPPLDALYMTIITIFTVGFHEVQPLSVKGQIFTILLILGGVGALTYGFTKLGDMVFGGGMSNLLWRKKMQRQIRNLKNHYIVCGHGRMGQTVADRLAEEDVPFVVIDNQESQLDALAKGRQIPFILGDATQEDILMEAGVKRAKGLAALLPTDADNLYLTLTAKGINPSIFVLSKVLDEEAAKKILQIGANKVVSPYQMGALKIAQSLLRPTLVEFMDLIIRRKELSLLVEEMVVPKLAPIVGYSFAQSQIRQRANVIVVAIKKPGEDIHFNPSPDIEIQSGDTLLVLGADTAIKKFEDSFIKESRP